MNQLALRLVIGTLSAQAAGCVIETTTRDGSGSTLGAGDISDSLSARWSLRRLGDGAVVACPAGIDTAQLVAQPLDATGAPLGAAVTDLFDCGAGVGESTGLAPGTYQVWLELRSHDLATLYARSRSQTFDVSKRNQVFSTELFDDGGYFQPAWQLVGRTTGQPIDCAEIDGLTSIHVHSVSASRVYDHDLVCQDHTAVTGGLLQGSYTVAISARTGTVDAGVAASLPAQTIADHDQITDLGLITIPVDGR